MGRKRSYPAAFRQQMVALVRSGRSANDLAKEFEPTAQTISAIPSQFFLLVLYPIHHQKQRQETTCPPAHCYSHSITPCHQSV